jgi:hypothetical protein
VARSNPGSEAQIDYGRLGMWCDRASGRRVAVWVFAMILSYSRALFVQPVLRMDQRSWNASHVAAFEFFGVPARLVCDNLKTGVTRPDLYDPRINLAYGELAGFYYGVGLLDFLVTTSVEGAVSMPKRYPEEFRRKVLDLVAAGRPVAPIWISATRRSTAGAARS